MKKYLLIFLFLIGAASVSAEPYTPSQSDMKLIVSGLAEKMLDPSSTIASQVLAADRRLSDGSKMTDVCGNVRGRNGYGGYAQPVPFYGALMNANDGRRIFVVISIASQDAASQLNVLSACSDAMEKVAGGEPIETPGARSETFDFDACVRKTCVSVNQHDCWIKGGAKLCDESGEGCYSLPENTPATALEKADGKWWVSIPNRNGWVDGRMIVVNGAACM